MKINHEVDCYRVRVSYWRRNAAGRLVIVEREGPIIAADDPETARARALVICQDYPDFARVGPATFLHRKADHRLDVVSLVPEQRPVPAPMELEDVLLSMLAHIRRRKR